MTTRVTSAGPGTGVIATDIAPRVTPPRTRPFRAVVDAGANALVDGAAEAARRLPGGPIIAAALRPVTMPNAALGGAGAPLGATSSPEGSAGTGTPATGLGADGTGIEQALGENSDRTLYYLELQERINGENQYFTALSNVLKAEHEMVKVAIGNIR